MWTKLIYLMLLWGFFCTTKVHGKRKMRDLEVRRITIFGSHRVRQEKCLFIPSYGTCKKNIVVYGYSIVTNRCTDYFYSGCGGNPNRFATYDECRTVCYVAPVKKNITQPDYYENDEVTEQITSNETDDTDDTESSTDE
ncbi:early lactation protein [Drosophila erecta]|uniref:early lactation protein n=1 Tax=Drosophila erecta TaxID=7220 RepID=UPI0007329563|nr:early lactation protein [Drosophila erecta]KQS52440.1 uncharacterized protein Dere_GG16735 [Drosophila erecta]